MKNLKKDVPSRSVGEVGKGDFIKVGSVWKEIASNSGEGPHHQKSWSVETTDGGSYGMFSIKRYAKKEDLEG